MPPAAGISARNLGRRGNVKRNCKRTGLFRELRAGGKVKQISDSKEGVGVEIKSFHKFTRMLANFQGESRGETTITQRLQEYSCLRQTLWNLIYRAREAILGWGTWEMNPSGDLNRRQYRLTYTSAHPTQHLINQSHTIPYHHSLSLHRFTHSPRIFASSLGQSSRETTG